MGKLGNITSIGLSGYLVNSYDFTLYDNLFLGNPDDILRTISEFLDFLDI